MSEIKIGRCHCGAVEFHIECENGIGILRRCNCSICRKKAAIMASVPLEKLRVVKGSENLSIYQWNTKTAKHYFCKTCGIYTHHQRRSKPNEFAFNVACIQGPDPTCGADIEMVDGASNSLVE